MRVAKSLNDYEFEGHFSYTQKYIDENTEMLRNNHNLTNKEKEEIMMNLSDEYISEQVEGEAYEIFESEEFIDYMTDTIESKSGESVENLHVDIDDSYKNGKLVINVKADFEDDDY